jgi:hypothetical protein
LDVSTLYHLCDQLRPVGLDPLELLVGEVLLEANELVLVKHDRLFFS